MTIKVYRSTIHRLTLHLGAGPAVEYETAHRDLLIQQGFQRLPVICVLKPPAHRQNANVPCLRPDRAAQSIHSDASTVRHLYYVYVPLTIPANYVVLINKLSRVCGANHNRVYPVTIFTL